MSLFRSALHRKSTRVHFESSLPGYEQAACGMTGDHGALKITGDPRKVNCGNCIVVMTTGRGAMPPIPKADAELPPERDLYQESAGGQTTMWERDERNFMWPLLDDGSRLNAAEVPSYQQLYDAVGGDLHPIGEIQVLRYGFQRQHAALREEGIL